MLLEAFRRCPPTTRLWIASDGPDTRPAAGRARRRRADHVARADQRRREVRPPARRRRVLRPVAARRVVRRRADRGDGRRHAGRRQRPRRLPQRGHRRRRRPARRRPATSTALAPALARRADRRRPRRSRCATAGARRAEDFSMTHAGRRVRAHLPRAARDDADARRAGAASPRWSGDAARYAAAVTPLAGRRPHTCSLRSRDSRSYTRTP